MFDGVSILLVGEPVHDQSTKLTQNILRDISWTLGGEHTRETILSTFLGNQAKGIEPNASIFVTNCSAKKLMRLIQKHNYRFIAKLTFTGNTEQVATNYVEQ